MFSTVQTVSTFIHHLSHDSICPLTNISKSSVTDDVYRQIALPVYCGRQWPLTSTVSEPLWRQWSTRYWYILWYNNIDISTLRDATRIFSFGKKNRVHNTYRYKNRNRSIIIIQRSPWGCGWLGMPGVSQVEKGEHSRSYACEPMWGSLLLHCCCWPVCLLRRCFWNPEEVWVGTVQIVLRMAHKTYMRAHTEASFVAVTKGRSWSAPVVAATTYK